LLFCESISLALLILGLIVNEFGGTVGGLLLFFFFACWKMRR